MYDDSYVPGFEDSEAPPAEASSAAGILSSCPAWRAWR
ncbi:LOW QUALITY PROTEIN: CACNB3 isoform 2 [Pongo abelii]|uniref:Calcium voltage-gated channel auxiliary subunit beta 3 n=2 Tax=Hominidae TaxID=9604 RepID=F8W1N3_HUMAN|nr:LOW QUALITY PROTEIN: CACNB3 isoform 2 [Pongo abelii]